MGRIKTKNIKRNSRQLIDSDSSLFSEAFDENKVALGSTLSSKRVRNKIAGYIARLKKNTTKIIDDSGEDGNKRK